MSTPNRASGNDPSAKWPLLLGGLSFALGAVWALVVPPFGAPDEPAHAQAVAQVRDRLELPTLRIRFDEDPTGVIVWPPPDRAMVEAARRFGQTDPLRLAPYESFQPPLYYMLGALVSLPVRSDPVATLYVLRLLSVVFGAATVVACYFAARFLAPSEPVWAIAAAGALALVPQASFNAATAGNDSLVNFLCALGLASLLKSLRDPNDDPWLVRAGAIAGAALLAKQNGLALVPAIGLTALFRCLDAPKADRFRLFARMTIGATSAFMLVGGWTFGRNLFFYGEPTGVADAAKYFRARFIPISIASGSAWGAVIATAWQSFWGRFGWMDKRLPEWAYQGTLVIVVVMLGMTVARGAALVGRISKPAWRSMVLMVTVCLATAALFVWVNFVSHGFQAQGRYFLPVAVPIMMGLTGGPAWSGKGKRARWTFLYAAGAWLVLLQAMGLSAARR